MRAVLNARAAKPKADWAFRTPPHSAGAFRVYLCLATVKYLCIASVSLRNLVIQSMCHHIKRLDRFRTFPTASGAKFPASVREWSRMRQSVSAAFINHGDRDLGYFVLNFR